MHTLSRLLATHAIHLVLFAPAVLFSIGVLVFARRRPAWEQDATADSAPAGAVVPAGAVGPAGAHGPTGSAEPAIAAAPGGGAGRATALPVLAVCSGVAAIIHGAVCPQHFHESTLYGLFFLLVASSQLVFAALVITRPRRWLLRAGLVGNLAVTGLWLLTRTSGIPLGPAAGTVEEIGIFDVIATAAELGAVACCAVALRGRDRGPAPAAWRPADWSRPARLALVCSTVVVAVAVLTVTP